MVGTSSLFWSEKLVVCYNSNHITPNGPAHQPDLGLGDQAQQTHTITGPCKAKAWNIVSKFPNFEQVKRCDVVYKIQKIKRKQDTSNLLNMQEILAISICWKPTFKISLNQSKHNQHIRSTWSMFDI